MLTLTGHKIYGPKGTGALIVRGHHGISPLHFGGGQERGLRPGTEDVAGAVGLATALGLAVDEARAESRRLAEIRDAVESALRASVSGLRVNGDGLPRAPHILSLAIPGADSDTLLAALDAAGLAASGGSACASGSSAPSTSLSALYPGDTATALRLSFGRLNTDMQVGRIVEAVTDAVTRTRALVAS
jgi:cysteine desulfurase